MVAAQRFVLMAARRGSARQRERPATVPVSTLLIPSSVSTESEDFYHPLALLADVFADGDEVRVALEPKVRVGGAGQPRLSRWAIIAFATSEAQPAYAAPPRSWGVFCCWKERAAKRARTFSRSKKEQVSRRALSLSLSLSLSLARHVCSRVRDARERLCP